MKKESDEIRRLRNAVETAKGVVADARKALANAENELRLGVIFHALNDLELRGIVPPCKVQIVQRPAITRIYGPYGLVAVGAWTSGTPKPILHHLNKDGTISKTRVPDFRVDLDEIQLAERETQ